MYNKILANLWKYKISISYILRYFPTKILRIIYSYFVSNWFNCLWSTIAKIIKSTFFLISLSLYWSIIYMYYSWRRYSLIYFYLWILWIFSIHIIIWTILYILTIIYLLLLIILLILYYLLLFMDKFDTFISI